ncbi:peptidoglycan DD-metalloendopeptidase family protein [Mesorhizobium sp. BAC0120]|uniref:peptidoglycan DD-metalloendopeptidase family protein n=1 Tax=Mesorhizobium sp. BAC0120 TaxID=3090670 RepID=UPI00298BDD49|nr:peptidoglycan DD-metalloendopeptidase family protein [Mesorhizobium sp. BAC0120]MDW6023958.1 peptidoglycan DD-metalloendopeptidase family protein [Mesorhizobium sp. BAC0120]
MRLSILRVNERRLVQGAAIFIIGGLASGCSSDVMRFTYGTDGTFTGATANQRQIIAPDQPYPGDNPAPAASVDGTNTGPVSRGVAAVSGNPVTKSALPPVAGTKVAAVDSKPLVRLQEGSPPPAPKRLDSTVTGTVTTTVVPTDPENDPVGWSRTGGTQVTAKDGETVYNLSRRFGVPADVLMKMNGISEANGLKVGQKVIIPTYVYHSKAPVSAPDSNPKVAAAKSSHGVRTDTVPGKLPATGQPLDKVAVLPKSSKPKEAEAQPADTANDKTAIADNGPDKAKSEKVATPAKGTYVVQAGDTLSKVAKKNGVSAASLKQANGLDNGLLKVGQTLKLPAAATGAPEQVASVAKAPVDAVTTGTTGPVKKVTSAEISGYTPPQRAEKKIEDADVDTAAAAPDSTGIGKMRWPVRGRVISGFGKGSGRSNDGIDIAVPEGTPIKAAENGVVIYAGDGLKDFGNTVLVRHDDGLVTVYGHASEIDVKRGDKVKRGQEIARSGMSGTTDAPKLHFEVRKNSAPVNPSTYLE